MSGEEGFLRAIAENPAEDGPRLVYADWLEERGDPRAEILRLEDALSRCPDGDSRRASLEARLRELLPGVGIGWLSVAGRRGPFLLALTRDESVILKLESSGVFTETSWQFTLGGPRPLQAAVTWFTSAPRGSHTANPQSPLALTDEDVNRLDALLRHYRATSPEGQSVNVDALQVEWYSGGKRVHQDSFVDRSDSSRGHYLDVLRELANRACRT
jgi:uncharacterized protein (TIGR02996 family)